MRNWFTDFVGEAACTSRLLTLSCGGNIHYFTTDPSHFCKSASNPCSRDATPCMVKFIFIFIIFVKNDCFVSEMSFRGDENDRQHYIQQSAIARRMMPPTKIEI